MRNGTYRARRRETATTTNYIEPNFSRNRNTVKILDGKYAPRIVIVAIFGVLVTVLGLQYAGQSSRATSYDYQLSDLNAQIDDLEAQKEDLAVEKARLTSIAASNNSQVAKNMENATVSGYAE